MYTKHIKSKYCPIFICTLEQCSPLLFLCNKHVRLVADGYNSERRKIKDSNKATTTSKSFTKKKLHAHLENLHVMQNETST